jgi:hypothetical protein
MGVHHAPRSSSHAARLAGRGALTAAAALALAGGTASMAFASEVPSVPTTQDIASHAKGGTHDLQNAQGKATAAASKAEDGSSAAKADATHLAGNSKNAKHFASNTKNDAHHAAYNWAGAAKGGITPSEASHQFGLMKADATHAAHHGKADFADLAASAPQLGSFSS